MSSHPWSSDVEAQAAIRAAEVDRGPTLMHHEVPGAVEALCKRLDTFIEDEQSRHDAMSQRVARLEAAADSPHPVAAPVPDSAGAVGLRTERVMVEVTHDGAIGPLDNNFPWLPDCRPEGYRVRVVPTPTPGPGLSSHERWRLGEIVRWLESRSRAASGDQIHRTLCDCYRADIESILARDAAGRDAQQETSDGDVSGRNGGGPDRRCFADAVGSGMGCGSSVVTPAPAEEGAVIRAERDMLHRRYLRCVELRDKDGETIASLTAEPDEAIRERDAALARVNELENECVLLRRRLEGESAKGVNEPWQKAILSEAVSIIVDGGDLGRGNDMHGGKLGAAVIWADKEIDGLRARVRELETAGEPVAREPDAWGVFRTGVLELAWDRRDPEMAKHSAANVGGTVVPLYATPQQERVVRLPDCPTARDTIGAIAHQAWQSVMPQVKRALDAAGVRWEVGE